jgi:methionyl-tRNA synthetase
MVKKENSKKQQEITHKTPVEVSSTVSFSDWQKIDLKVAEILEVEPIEGADKLYKLKIDLGTETRTLVAGLKEFYNKEELEGKRIIVFTNLEPRTIRGIESKGMVLAASNGDHSEVKLLQPDGVLELGSKVS